MTTPTITFHLLQPIVVILLLLLLTIQTTLVHGEPDAEFCQKDKECQILYQWVKMEYKWPNKSMEEEYTNDRRYDPTHCLLSGVKLYKGQLYVTIPRLRYYHGVPSTLNKVTVDPVDKRPKLEPFPDWQTQQAGHDCDNLQMAMSIEIDPLAGHIYVIDPGRPGIVGTPEPNASIPKKCPPKLVVFDLNDGTKIRSHEFPADVASVNTNFLNDIVLDRGDPNSKTIRWVYVTDAIDSKLYVTDLVTNQTRSLYDPSMDFEEEKSNIIVNGKGVQLALPIDGLAMTRDFKYVYYCALGSLKLWRVPTFVLRDPKYNISDHVFLVGDKISQTGGMIYATNSLYYGGLSQNAIFKWDVSKDMREQEVDEREVKINSEVKVAGDNDTMIWPDAFSIDEDGFMYFTACRANLFLKGGMDFSGKAGSNFRVWKINIGELGYLATPSESLNGGLATTASYGYVGYLVILLTLPLSRLIYSLRWFGST